MTKIFVDSHRVAGRFLVLIFSIVELKSRSEISRSRNGEHFVLDFERTRLLVTIDQTMTGKNQSHLPRQRAAFEFLIQGVFKK